MLKKIKKFLTYPISGRKINYGKFNPMNFNWGRIKNGLKIFVIFMAGVTLTVFTYQLIFGESDDETSDYIASQVIDYLDSNYFTPDDVQAGCNLKVITLHGDLVTHIPMQDLDENGNLLYDETSSDYIVGEIRDAKANENIKAIILEVDSAGGSPVAAEEVAAALKNSGKPTAALIREYGLSAAYYSASGADYIVAHKNSDVGSIGVTYSYTDNTKKNEKEGVTYNRIVTGKFKDTGSADRALTPEEKELLLRDARIIHENFVKTVADNRKLDIDKVRKLADGSSLLGEMALKNGLIDKVGDVEETMKYLEGRVGEELKVCE